MSATATALPALDNTMGVLYLSAVLSMALWGAAGVQMYYYFNTYPKDHWWMKTLVSLVYASDTVSQALMIQVAYVYLITNYANPLFLAKLVSTLLPIMLMTAVLSLGVQSFFIMRIWRLSKKNIWVTGFVLACTLAQFFSNVVFYGVAHGYTEFAQLVPKTNFMHVINSLMAASDAIIAIVLSFYLHTSRSGFKRTDTIINRLIMFTVNTGVLTGICAVLTLITNIAFPNTFIYMIFYIIVARVYTNSLLATLNSRDSVRRGMPDTTGAASSMANSVHLDRLRMRPLDGEMTKHTNHTLSIKVDTETTRDDGNGKISDDLESGYESSGKAQAL
ncbi:hypothetical protein SCHPADRAFT_242920 [Schizopora paradoxa]|uniref:DUF6534 domain-containing protein n=1 Tax=Schizopora paradoxa TaxID=27342 RepID=A0A0H2RWG9_9AGAM|nr:hypothetical protein SCHPADRAFT_242920 [Schizopora paradoxa]